MPRMVVLIAKFYLLILFLLPQAPFSAAPPPPGLRHARPPTPSPAPGAGRSLDRARLSRCQAWLASFLSSSRHIGSWQQFKILPLIAVLLVPEIIFIRKFVYNFKYNIIVHIICLVIGINFTDCPRRIKKYLTAYIRIPIPIINSMRMESHCLKITIVSDWFKLIFCLARHHPDGRNHNPFF